MAIVLEKTGKTLDEAIQAALDELGVNEKDVDIEILETPSKRLFGLFGGSPAKVKITLKEVPRIEVENVHEETVENITQEVKNEVEEVVEQRIDSPVEIEDEKNPPVDEKEVIAAAKKFLSDVFAAMKLNVEITYRKIDSDIVIDLHGENLGVLIGKHGQHLEALQYLTNLAANRTHSLERVHITLDVEDYREHREEVVKKIAKSAAERALRTRKEVKMEPMNRSERRIVHMMLQDNDRIETHSVGEDPHRYIIVSSKKRGR